MQPAAEPARDTDEARVRDFDPERLPPAFFDDPYPTYAALRRLAPAHRCPDGSWFLTRYRELDAVYLDREHFSSDKQAVFGAENLSPRW